VVGTASVILSIKEMLKCYPEYLGSFLLTAAYQFALSTPNRPKRAMPHKRRKHRLGTSISDPPLDLDPTTNHQLRSNLWSRLLSSIEKQK
jgi:hypothetical protein